MRLIKPESAWFMGIWIGVPDNPLGPLMRVITVLEAYRKHVEERAAQGIVPQPLNAEQTAGLVELLKNPAGWRRRISSLT